MAKHIRYYCLDKPPMPGTVPRGMTNIVDFGELRYVNEINTDACGYVEYCRELTKSELRTYKLTEAVHSQGCNEDYCEF